MESVDSKRQYRFLKEVMRSLRVLKMSRRYIKKTKLNQSLLIFKRHWYLKGSEMKPGESDSHHLNK